MTRFENGQRVRLTPDGALGVAYGDEQVTGETIDVVTAGLTGMTGTVVRLLRSGSGAWVDMDRELPREVRRFPIDDPYGRGRHLMLYPAECEPL